MDLRVELNTKRLDRRREEIITGILRGARKVVAGNTRLAELRLQAVTAAAVPGKNGLGRLGKVWSSEVYPQDGRMAYEPSGRIYLGKAGPRTRGTVRAYAYGARITGKQGQYLAIPLPAAGIRMTGRGRVSLTPGEWELRTGRRLRLMYRAGKAPLLVTDGVLSRNGKGHFRSPTAGRMAQGRSVETIAIFLLLPQVDVQKRFDIKGTVAPFQARMKEDMVVQIRLLAADQRKLVN